MSAISYANVVATGSASPTSQSDPTEISAALITESLNEVSISEEKTDEQTSSPTPSPKAEKVKKEIQLAPAPVPEVNAWGSANSSRSNSNVAVDTKYWPSPLENPLPNGVSNNNKKITVAKSSKEKWVPFKASVVLAEPNSNKKHGQKRNGQKNAVNNQKSNENKSRKNKSEKRSQNPKEQTNQQQSKQSQQHKEEYQPKPEVSSSSQEQEQQQDQQSEISTPSKDEINSNQTQDQKQKQQPQGNHQSHRSFNKSHQQNQQSNGHQQPFNNNFVPQYQPNQFYPPNQQFNRAPRPFGNSTRRYNKFNNNNGYIRNNNVHGYQQRRSFNENPYASYENVDPLFHLIKQVQYYFSPENLVKDLYLRKQMNDDGWLPLNVIANFYRMKVLSLGDFNLIRNSIDELNGSVLEIAEFEDNILKVRSKENFSHWVLPNSERDVAGNEESKFIKLIIKKTPKSSTEETSNVEIEDASPIEEEKQEITA